MTRLARSLFAVVLLHSVAFAGGLSNTFEDHVLNALFKQTNVTAPTTLAIGLAASDPGDTCANELLVNSQCVGSGNPQACCTGSGTGTCNPSYARVSLNPDPDTSTNTNWTAKEDGAGATRRVSNVLDIVFPTATGNWNSGSAIGWWVMLDSATIGSGTCVASGSITGGGITVNNGNTARFMGSTALGSTPGQLRLTVD